MANNRNTYEHIAPIDIDIDKWMAPANTVLFEYNPRENEQTPSGILVAQGWDDAQNAVRLGKVVKVPRSLYYNRSDVNKSMQWKTEIEIEEGDIAITNHMDSISAWVYRCNGKEYRSTNYASIEAVKRQDRIIPINGNILIKTITKTKKFLEYTKDIEERNIFEICYVGKRNLEYLVPEHVLLGQTVYRNDFNYPLEQGDKIIILNKFLDRLRPLEDEVHAKFDSGKQYMICKRYMIGGIINDIVD